MSSSHLRLATGTEPARAYVHAGMVAYQGEKMSKSLGNLVFVSHLREAGWDPMAIRLALLAHHFRADWEWTDRDLDDAQTRLTRWRAGVSRPQAPSASELLVRMRDELARDLHAPGALAAMDEWCAADGNDTDTTTVRDAIDALLGVLL